MVLLDEIIEVMVPYFGKAIDGIFRLSYEGSDPAEAYFCAEKMLTELLGEKRAQGLLNPIKPKLRSKKKQ